MSEKVEKMKVMLEKMDKMNLSPAGESDGVRNTEGRRKKLLWFVHCLHILRLDGGISVNDEQEILAVEELKRKISRCSDSETVRKESIRLSVINDHTHTWYIARHYYEKCSKILCQMMVTVMDFMLEVKMGESVLYSPEEKLSGIRMEKELALLSKAFNESYYYMCVYDYCTGKLAEYVDVPEYELLMPEHRRIVANGLPARLMRVADAYCKMMGIPDIIGDAAVKDPEVLYDEKLLAQVYDSEISKYVDLDFAMNNYQNIVAAVDYAYAAQMGGRQGG